MKSRLAAALMALAVSLFPASSHAVELDLTGYQREDGAITLSYKGDWIDPYFATKALLLAQDAELDARKPALAWLKWAMHAQRGDGLFNRYKCCVNDNWVAYAATDADDAMLAMWIQLVYRLAPSSGLPASWKDSVNRAEKQLANLYDKDTGVYHISESLRVGLLMDNVEIYSAFAGIAHDAKRMGQPEVAAAYRAKAKKLSAAIMNVFGREASTYAITTQERTETSFYPDHAAQVFPILYRMEEGDVRAKYYTWLSSHGKEWLEQRHNDFPWGLIAIVSLEMGDAESAACWQNRSEPTRYGGHWNLLEEVALQHVKYRLHLQNYNKVPCVAGNLV